MDLELQEVLSVGPVRASFLSDPAETTRLYIRETAGDRLAWVFDTAQFLALVWLLIGAVRYLILRPLLYRFAYTKPKRR